MDIWASRPPWRASAALSGLVGADCAPECRRQLQAWVAGHAQRLEGNSRELRLHAGTSRLGDDR